jgi:hypothetical protein
MSSGATEGLNYQAPTGEDRGARDRSTRAPKKGRPRNRDKTLEKLELAVLTVKNRGKKLTFVAVADEAGVTPGLIHNTYPDLAESIRTQGGKATRQQRDAAIAELTTVRQRNKELRAELKTSLKDIKRLASTNETLRQELTKLRAASTGKVVILPSKDPGNR